MELTQEAAGDKEFLAAGDKSRCQLACYIGGAIMVASDSMELFLVNLAPSSLTALVPGTEQSCHVNEERFRTLWNPQNHRIVKV